jgi:Bacterial RNA polymerase, alpha chain C terminal domain
VQITAAEAQAAEVERLREELKQEESLKGGQHARMFMVVSGFGRDHGERVIARRDLTEAGPFRGYCKRPEVYITSTEGREPYGRGVRVVENGNVELRFVAKITLNGEYFVRQTLSRKEVAKLFLSQYNGCSFQELIDVINEARETPDRDFPSIMRKHVNDIGLSDRAVAWLKKNNIWQVGDLVQKTERALRDLPDYDAYAFSEIRDWLTPLGLQLGMRVEGWPDKSLLLKKLDEFELPLRTANCLKNDNIVHLVDLVQKTEAEMLRLPNFVRKSLNEIKEGVFEPTSSRCRQINRRKVSDSLTFT